MRLRVALSQFLSCGLSVMTLLQGKNSGLPNLHDIYSANNLIRDLSLLEPPIFGGCFTWTNGKVYPTWIQLDRFLVNSLWNLQFPKVFQSCLPRLGSNHVPIG